VTDKFEFIDAEYAAYQESDERYVPSIVKMCRWMEARLFQDRSRVGAARSWLT
jgi:hypothetical protein